MRRQRGRIPPPELLYSEDRVRTALAMRAAHLPEMQAHAATLPDSLQLGDRRVLIYDRPMAGGKAYRCVDGLVVIATFDPTPHGTLLHLSASYVKRLPRWRDLTFCICFRHRTIGKEAGMFEEVGAAIGTIDYWRDRALHTEAALAALCAELAAARLVVITARAAVSEPSAHHTIALGLAIIGYDAIRKEQTHATNHATDR